MKAYIQKIGMLVIACVTIFFSLGTGARIKTEDKGAESESKVEEDTIERIDLITKILVALAATGVGGAALGKIGEQLGGGFGKTIGQNMGWWLGFGTAIMELGDKKAAAQWRQGVKNFVRYHQSIRNNCQAAKQQFIDRISFK